MTVSTTVNRKDYTVNNISQTSYVYDFRVDAAADMKVYLNGVLQSSGDYTVNNLGEATGGTIDITFTTALDDSLVLIRILDLDQEIDYITFGKFPSKSHERGLDNATMISQQLQEELNRCIKSDIDNPFGITFPSPSPGDTLVWNTGGTGFDNAPGIGTFTALAAAAAASAAAAAASAGSIESTITGEVGKLVKVDPNGEITASVFNGDITLDMIYNSSKDYPVGYEIFGSNGLGYRCYIPNGPSSSVVSPIDDDTGTWCYSNIGLPGTQINLPFEPTATQLIQMRLLERDGSSVLDADYPGILTFWNSTKIYGNADATHFNLPDDRGYFERIFDNSAGVDPDAATRTDRGDGTTGDEVGTKEGDTFQGHWHQQYYDELLNESTGSESMRLENANTNTINAGDVRTVRDPISDTVNGTPRTSSETRPTNVYKWGGIFY